MLEPDNNSYLISLNILITCLQTYVRLLQGEVTSLSLLGVKGFIHKGCSVVYALSTAFFKISPESWSFLFLYYNEIGRAHV